VPGHPTDILTANRPDRQHTGKPVIYPRQQVPGMAGVTDYGPGQGPFYPASAAAAARAASGSAAAMTAMAASSWAADRNHASNGDGGR